MKIGLATMAGLVQKMAGREAVETERRRDGMRLVESNQMSQATAAGGNRLEASRAPAPAQVKPPYRSSIDDWGAIGHHVHDASPASQDAQPSEHGHERHRAGANILDSRQIAALRVRVVRVDIAAKHQPALVR